MIIAQNPSNKNFCKIIPIHKIKDIDVKYSIVIFGNLYVIPQNYNEIKENEISATKEIKSKFSILESTYTTEMALILFKKQQLQKTR